MKACAICSTDVRQDEAWVYRLIVAEPAAADPRHMVWLNLLHNTRGRNRVCRTCAYVATYRRISLTDAHAIAELSLNIRTEAELKERMKGLAR